MALFIGFTMGLIGGGGSILAVPVFAYLFGFDEKIATANSLFVVGLTALFGGAKQYKNIHWPTVIVFGIPAIFAVWITRHSIVPNMPDVLFQMGSFEVTRRMLMLGLFSILMFVAAVFMLKDSQAKPRDSKAKLPYPLIFFEGIIVGGLTGLVGAGGGFLIVPALVIMANLEIKTAIASSLMIIALKSLIGFLFGDALCNPIDWNFLFGFAALAIVGIVLGSFAGNFIDGKKLKKIFGYFIIVMAIFIFVMEFIVKN